MNPTSERQSRDRRRFHVDAYVDFLNNEDWQLPVFSIRSLPICWRHRAARLASQIKAIAAWQFIIRLYQSFVALCMQSHSILYAI